MRIETKSFSELTVAELYALLQLRAAVFVVEQNCIYQDLDGKDQASHHLMLWDDQNDLLAYSRILPKGISYSDYCSIGRVVSRSDLRNLGIGRRLMEESIRTCKTLFPQQAIKISAQSYLRKFYESFGFEFTGDEYLEDHILHMGMILKY